MELVISSPSVVYKIVDNKGKERFVYSATDWPEAGEIKESSEPFVTLEIIAPKEYLGKIMEITERLRAKYVRTDYLGENTVFLVFESPLQSIIVDFYDNLKSATQGYGSLNYEFLDYRPADLVKLDILIAGEKEEALSKIVAERLAEKEGRKIVKKLKEVLPAQLFSVPLQAAVSSRVLARETLRARGKDVISGLYGGDYSRKRKVLERQKKGKKKLKEKGGVKIPSKVFLEIFKTG